MDRDREHLQLLSIFHYVLAGFTTLCALFPIIHLIVGVALLVGAVPQQPGDPDPRILGAMFVIFPAVWIVTGLVVAVLIVLAGRCLSQRRRYMFCMVMAGIESCFMPVGTVLGVFTIMVLMRDSVRALFGVTPGA